MYTQSFHRPPTAHDIHLMAQRFLLVILLFCTVPLAAAQEVTEADYARAEATLSLFNLVYNGAVTPNWLEDDRFWYHNRARTGTEVIFVDPAAGTRAVSFDSGRLAQALTAYTGEEIAVDRLQFMSFQMKDDGRAVTLRVGRERVRCDIDTFTCAAADSPPQPARNSATSPDGKLAAYIDNHNLWVQELATGAKTQLTTDGVQDYGYATNNAGWTRNDTPVLLWSPDSRKIATFQHDARGVGEMYMITTEVGHPQLEAWKYPLPEDSVIFRISRVVIHVDEPRIVRLDMAPDAHRGTTTDHIAGWGGTFLDVRWSGDSEQLAFVSSSRDHKDAWLRVADPNTGAVRTVLHEHVDTYFESGVDAENWDVLFDSGEVLWFSERDNWGHLYLYDLESGDMKHQITSGDWAVQQVRRTDERERTVYFTAKGREDTDPYYNHFYKINLDGSGLTLLTPESMNHSVTISPSGRYFVNSFSTPVAPPVSVLRDMNGKVVVELEEADISGLEDRGWVPPVPFTVKARDGETDLYGLMYQPSNFDETRSYPVLNYLYPGPQSGSVGSRSFRPSRGDKQALAELGFIVVEVDAMGTPGRSKSFHDAYYGNMGDNGLPDQITMIRQLGERHRWMDLDRVGIWGHSGGGFASAGAILRYPDFYKVAVSGAGNHDNRNYEDDWGEKWQGLLTENADGTTNYDNQSNILLAGNLEGKLLIAHGLMDGNVPASNTLLLVEALVAANKDFDLVVFPNGGHGFGRGGRTYWMRKRWDYFVRHLLGAEPPKEYEFGRQRMRVTEPSG